MRYVERNTGLITPNVLVSEVDTINLNDIGAGDTFTLTMTEIGDPATVSTTGTITFDASTTTLAANIQTAVRAVTGFAASTVGWDSAQIYRVTFIGTKTGNDLTLTITGATGFTPGAVTNITQGSAAYTTNLYVGRFFVPKRVRISGFNDNSLDISLTDAAARSVYVRTGMDMSSASADVPSDEYLTADGVAGEDGAAAANVCGGLFEGPLTLTVTTSGATHTGRVLVFGDMGNPSGSSFKFRSTGTFLGATAEVNLGAPVAKVRRIRLDAVSDTGVAPVITDKYGKNIYTKTSTDYVTPVDVVLSHAGVDQAGNAVADLLDVVVASPVLVTLTGHDGTGFKVDFFVET